VLNGVLGALYAPDQLLALAVPSESDREGIWFGLAMAGQEYNSLRSLARSTANSPTTASGTRITSRTHTGTGEAATSTRTQYTASGGDKLIVDPNRDPAFAQQLSRSARSAIARRTSNTISRPTLVQQEVEAVFTRPSYTARDAVYNSNGGVAYMSEVMRCGVCREQAIYSHSLLAELGMRSQVAIGNGIFGREAGRHAWVEYTDTVTGQPYVLDTAFFRGVIDRATYYARYSIDTESVGYHTFMEP